jgi:hypothetical protein
MDQISAEQISVLINTIRIMILEQIQLERLPLAQVVAEQSH